MASREIVRRIEHDFCAVCSTPVESLKELGEHMMSAHNRIILDKDINAAKSRREEKARAAEANEEALFA